MRRQVKYPFGIGCCHRTPHAAAISNVDFMNDDIAPDVFESPGVRPWSNQDRDIEPVGKEPPGQIRANKAVGARHDRTSRGHQRRLKDANCR